MRLILAGVLACVTTAVSSAADTPKPTPAERLAAIQKESKDTQTKLYKTLEDLGDSTDARKKADELFQQHEKEQTKRYEAALELAKADPKSDVAFESLEWMLTIPRVYYLPVGKPVMELALEHHATNPKIGKATLMLGRFGPYDDKQENYKLSRDLLRTIGEKNPDKTVRGQVAMVNAWKAKGAFDAAEFKKAKDMEALATVAERAMEVVITEYGECVLLGRGEKQTLAETATVDLFELRNLRVGKVAPDIDGEDLDGLKFKLSDYRGKVVVLDFWGDW